MNEFSKKQLLINYVLGICTEREKEKIEDWLAEDEQNIRLLQKAANQLEEGHDMFSPREKEQIKENIFKNINANSTDSKTFSFSKSKYTGLKGAFYTHKKVFFKRVGFWVKAAAVLILISLASSAAYYYSNKKLAKPAIVWQKQTLPYGQTATLRLSDGSTVKLNGGSTLRYPESFKEDKRVVYLEGEAFFSIAPDKSRPFIVHAGNITTRVLGTSFNIEAYSKEDEIQVVVAEGTVAVVRDKPNSSAPISNTSIILEKNQWVTYQNSVGMVEKGEGDIWKKIAWKDNVLVFNNKPFAEVARMLERWYGIDIKIKDEALEKMIVEGAYKDVSLKHVLESIEFILGAEYSVNDDTVTFQLPEITEAT